ncbi:hypothetical protein Btru_026784 [Bulinus truncatus]|nr:hypothetical protein Btru_026784 [Bulinus truncatus]
MEVVNEGGQWEWEMEVGNGGGQWESAMEVVNEGGQWGWAVGGSNGGGQWRCSMWVGSGGGQLGWAVGLGSGVGSGVGKWGWAVGVGNGGGQWGWEMGVYNGGGQWEWEMGVGNGGGQWKWAMETKQFAPFNVQKMNKGFGFGQNFNKFHSEKPVAKNEDRNLIIPRMVLNCFSRGSNREMFCDFTVVVDDVEFPCHRFVLNACSGFFEALFRSDMKERQEMRVTVHGVSRNTFQQILDIIYSGSDILTQENVLDLWKAAHQLQMEVLVTICENYVLENINVGNCFEVYLVSQLLTSHRVVEFVANYMRQNFFAVVGTEKFVELQYDDILKILRNQGTNVCVDFQIESILKWCSEADVTQSSRLSYLGDLIQAVNLAGATKECLAGLMTNKFILDNKIAITAINRHVAESLMNSPSAMQHGVLFKFPQTVNSCQHCVNKRPQMNSNFR